MKIRQCEFDLKKNTYVMGILNVTPDSFSDGGLHNTKEKAVEHALLLEKQGAAIIDIGGESTRPGFTPVSADEEIRRVIPVIEAIRKVSDVPISVDTTKPEVADLAMKAGADIINTVQGVDAPDEMLRIVKETNAIFVMTYERNYVNQFGEALIGMAEHAVSAGIPQENIIVDPGVGFGKTPQENLRIVNELPILTQTGYPFLLGCSRKSMIKHVNEMYKLADGSFDDDRLTGTVVTTVLATLAGVSFVRVHDVRENINAIRMVSAICDQTSGEV